MTEFQRRDVRLIIDTVNEVKARIDNLRKLTMDAEPARRLALANTYNEITRLFLQEVANAPEVQE